MDVAGAKAGRAALDQEAADAVIGHLAQTTAMSAILPLVIHIFVPFKI